MASRSSNQLQGRQRINYAQGPNFGEVVIPTAAPAAMAAVVEVFETNPYSGNINPASTNGLKLYQAATSDKDDDEKLDASIKKSTQFIEAMKADSAKFSWLKLISSIPVDGSNKDIL